MLPAMSTNLDLSYFQDHLLQTENGLGDAMTHLSAVLAAAEVCIEQLVTLLLSVPNRFAYICTVFPEYSTMRNKIMNAFPTNPADLCTSFVRCLLIQFSTLFLVLPPNSFTEDGSRLVGQYKRYVMDAWPALSVLLAAINARPQKSSKAKRKTFFPKVNEVPLNNLGVVIPSNADEAGQLAAGILRTLNNILCFYFDLLSEPDLADFVRDAYFSGNDSFHLGSQRQTVHRAPEVHTDVDQSPSMPEIYPRLQPLKAALQVDNVEGFGQWDVIISSGATKDLKEIKRSDKERAEFVVNKIFQLSKGRFSGNNQRRLNGPSHGIPIYQAEVLSNLRIVYQIDCIPDDDGLTEHQVIKIYSIVTHKKLDHIWESLSNHLSKSKEYRERCNFRQRAPGTNTYIPTSFPRRQTDPDEDETHIIFNDDDLSQVYSPSLLDKYVKFSKAYLDDLISEEVQPSFQLTADEWEIVQSTTSCFVIGSSGTGKTTAMLYKMLEIHRAWQKTTGYPKPRQMFVTRSRALRAKVEESFNNLLESLALAGRTREELRACRAQGLGGQEIAMIDPTNALDCRPGTPQKFSELTDNDFPLFITFDHLARIVAADLQHDDNPHAKLLTCLDDKYSFVKYEDFVNQYWPRLPQRATRGLAPWLVFSEFISVIKGSEAALHQPGGCLDEQTYIEMPTRAYKSFAHQREALYEAFEAYCRLKHEERGYDMADRTHSILKPLLSHVPLKGRGVDYMYVDEVQDILITDALLLRILCRNPEGLFWAGDTVQTISAGSSFRFEDLTAFMYRAERDDTMGLELPRKKPVVFQLTTNHRSHSGIVNCAQAVIGLIGRFWPDTIDILRAEQGRTHGLKPMFLSDWQEGMFTPEQFFSGMKEKQIELGAEQCILVRDNAARERLKEQVGDSALILTLHESKGLAFNDIFLYNFFEDSAADRAQWHLVLAECGDYTMSTAFKRDKRQYAVLCIELKDLYFGITRARKNLYLLDRSNKSEPMRTFWLSRDLIRRAPTETNIFDYVVNSDPDEWAASGRKLFAVGQFNEAIRCFRRAGESYQHELRIAQAFQYRTDANRIIPVSAARSAFLVAAEAFTDCAEETLNPQFRMEYYSNAGDCYARGRDVNRAGISYILAENFVAATRVYHNAKNLDEIIQMFENHHMKIIPDYDSILFSVCRQYYGSRNIKPPKPLFPSVEDELNYLMTEGFDDTRIAVLESIGRNIEAAKVHLCRGQPEKAVEACLKAQHNDEDTFQHAVDIVLGSLWPRCSFTAVPTTKFFQKGTPSGILEIALNFPSERLDASDHDQIRFFDALRQASDDQVYQLGCQFLHRGDDLLALATFDRVFSQFPALSSASLDEMDQFLKQFAAYVHLLISVIASEDPLLDPKARRVFGVIELPNHYYGVQEGTFLYDKSTSNRYLRVDLNMRLKTRLRAHLRRKVTQEIKLCCSNPQLSAVSCLSYLVDGICHEKRCKCGHVSRDSEGPRQYNARVSIHLRQICILQSMHDSCPQDDWNESTRDWLVRLYDAVHPPLYFQGSVANLDLSMIEDIGSCMIVLQKWIEDTFQYLLSGDDFWKYLMEATRLARLAFTFGGHLIVFNSIRIAKCSPFYWVPSLRPTHPDDSFVMESIVKGFNGADDCISYGVSALQYVLHKGVRLDLSIIYDYIEDMCRNLVLLCHLHPSGCSPLHDLLVPGKWLVNTDKFIGNKGTSPTPAFVVRLQDLQDCLHSSKAHNTSSIYAFLDCMQDLLDRLRSGKAKRWFSFPGNQEAFIDIAVAKLCRLLSIVGYNTCDSAMSERIAEILLFSLRANMVKKKPREIVHAIRRSEYLSVIRSFDQDTCSEDLVRLTHEGKGDTTSPVSPYIAPVVYSEVADIPRVVCHSPDVSAHLVVVQGPYIELAEAKFTEDTENTHESIDPAEVLNRKWSNPTEQEITAACQIQMAYRLYRIRCAPPTTRFPSVTAINKSFMLCLDEVIFLGWKPDRYRWIYLNKLPILLACLERGLEIAYAVKKEAPKNPWKESGKKQKDGAARVDQSIILINEGKRLRKILDPQAPLHDRPNIHAFRTVAKEVSKFIRRIPIDSEGWDDSWKDAVDSVIAELEVYG